MKTTCGKNEAARSKCTELLPASPLPVCRNQIPEGLQLRNPSLRREPAACAPGRLRRPPRPSQPGSGSRRRLSSGSLIARKLGVSISPSLRGRKAFFAGCETWSPLPSRQGQEGGRWDLGSPGDSGVPPAPLPPPPGTAAPSPAPPPSPPRHREVASCKVIIIPR